MTKKSRKSSQSRRSNEGVFVLLLPIIFPLSDYMISYWSWGGYIVTPGHLLVGLFVWKQDLAKTTAGISMNLSWRMMFEPFNVGVDLDQGTDPGFLSHLLSLTLRYMVFFYIRIDPSESNSWILMETIRHICRTDIGAAWLNLKGLLGYFL